MTCCFKLQKWSLSHRDNLVWKVWCINIKRRRHHFGRSGRSSTSYRDVIYSSLARASSFPHFSFAERHGRASALSTVFLFQALSQSLQSTSTCTSCLPLPSSTATAIPGKALGRESGGRDRWAGASSCPATEKIENEFSFSHWRGEPQMVILAIWFAYSNSSQNYTSISCAKFDVLCGEILLRSLLKFSCLLYVANLILLLFFRTPTIRWGYVAMQFAQVNLFKLSIRFVDCWEIGLWIYYSTLIYLNHRCIYVFWEL